MEDVLRECHVLEKAGRPKGSDRDTCKAVIQLCEFIRGLNQNERERRLKLLQALDKKSHSPDNTPSVESDGYRPRFSIQSFADYCRIAQLPVERLELALKTGQIKTEEEEQQEREAFYFTLRLLDSQEGRRAKKALESFAHQRGQRQRLDPTLDLTHVALEVVEAVPPFYSQLIEATKISPRPDMLRIGVTGHAIVRALVELARWREAKEWTTHYFSLPMEYQDGKQGEMKILSDRCERMLKKIE